MLNKIKKYMMQKWINGPRHWMSINDSLDKTERIIDNPALRETALYRHNEFRKCKTEQQCIDFLLRFKKYKADKWYYDVSPSYLVALTYDDDCDSYAELEARFLGQLYKGEIKRMAFYHPKYIAHVIGYIKTKDEHIIFDYGTILHSKDLSTIKRYYIDHYVKPKYEKNKNKYKVSDVILTTVPEVKTPRGILPGV